MKIIAENVTYSIARNRLSYALREKNDLRAESLLEEAAKTGCARTLGAVVKHNGQMINSLYTVIA